MESINVSILTALLIVHAHQYTLEATLTVKVFGQNLTFEYLYLMLCLEVRPIDCLVDNGGCDWHVECVPGNSTTVGSCGECPLGFSGSGYIGCTSMKVSIYYYNFLTFC